MKILNVMFSKGLGGIERVFLDYTRALIHQGGHEVTSLVHPKCAVLNTIKKEKLPFYQVDNMGAWDPFAVRNIKKLLERLKPDIVICHGNRALTLTAKAAEDKCPIVTVAHNYRMQHIRRAYAGLALTKDLRRHMLRAGMKENLCFVVPNMIDTKGAELDVRPWKNPPVIGGLGRFSEEKGFDILIEALALLAGKGKKFKAVLAGKGDEEPNLRALVRQRKLDGAVSFPGWLNPADFFPQVDILCVPSRSEAFGLVIVEAFLASTPVIAADIEGPAEICVHEKDALLVPPEDPEALAEMLSRALDDPEKTQGLAKEAFRTVTENYGYEPVIAKMNEALGRILQTFREERNV